ncbi:MAG: hypothetical protein IKA77_00135 [Clostridia bacterium]|nr:hypothetical protein [Clostridia bacterium]
MKKATRIISILTLIIVLVSAVFVASGCDNPPKTSFGATVTIYDHYYADTGDSMQVTISGYYQDGEVVITNAQIVDRASRAIWEKKWGDGISLGYSTLTYKRSEGGFYKGSIALVLEKQGIVGKDALDRFADYANQDTIYMSVLIKADDKNDFHSGSQVEVKARIRGMFTGTGYVR